MVGKNKNLRIYLLIAGFCVQIDCADKLIKEELTELYQGFLKTQSNRIHFFVAIRSQILSSSDRDILHPKLFFDEEGINVLYESSRGVINPKDKMGNLEIKSKNYTEVIDYYFRILFGLITFDYGGLLIHAAGIIHQNKTYIFCGHSGSGKTTIVRLSDGKKILNDDLIVITPGINNQWIAHHTPFSRNKWGEPDLKEAIIGCMFFLRKDQNVFLEEISSGEAIAEIIANTPIVSLDYSRSNVLVERAIKILSNLDYYRLHFRKDGSFWALIEGLNN